MKKVLPILKSPLGFTLVELLVVIAIIAILVTIGSVTFSGVQKNARDATRKLVVKNIAAALEAKKDIASGKYRFSTADLQTEFPDDVKAQSGQDPIGTFYCIDADGSNPLPNSVPSIPALPNMSTGWCPTNYSALSNAIASGTDLFNGTVPSWTLCARLEATSSAAFCMSSLTR